MEPSSFKSRLFKKNWQTDILWKMYREGMNTTDKKKLPQMLEASCKTKLPLKIVKEWISNTNKGTERGKRKKKHTEDLNEWTAFLSQPNPAFNGDPSKMGSQTKERSIEYNKHKETPEGRKFLAENLVKQKTLDPKELSKQQIQNSALGICERIEKETFKLDRLGFKAVSMVAPPEGPPTVLGPVGAVGFFHSRGDILNDYCQHVSGKNTKRMKPNDRRTDLRYEIRQLFNRLYAKLTGRKVMQYSAILSGTMPIRVVGLPCPLREVKDFTMPELEEIVRVKEAISLEFIQDSVPERPTPQSVNEQAVRADVVPNMNPSVAGVMQQGAANMTVGNQDVTTSMSAHRQDGAFKSTASIQHASPNTTKDIQYVTPNTQAGMQNASPNTAAEMQQYASLNMPEGMQYVYPNTMSMMQYINPNMPPRTQPVSYSAGSAPPGMQIIHQSMSSSSDGIRDHVSDASDWTLQPLSNVLATSLQSLSNESLSGPTNTTDQPVFAVPTVTDRSLPRSTTFTDQSLHSGTAVIDQPLRRDITNILQPLPTDTTATNTVQPLPSGKRTAYQPLSNSNLTTDQRLPREKNTTHQPLLGDSTPIDQPLPTGKTTTDHPSPIGKSTTDQPLPRYSTVTHQLLPRGKSATVQPLPTRKTSTDHPRSLPKPDTDQTVGDAPVHLKKRKVQQNKRVLKLEDRIEQVFIGDPKWYKGTVIKAKRGVFTIHYDGYTKKHDISFSSREIHNYLTQETLKLI